jgi:NADH-ubiquinone oxidoreductase chain 4
LFLEFLLIQVFSVIDLFLFYVYFESVLMPMFLIIGIWGSRERKIRAAYQFFIYTLVGSLLMLVSLILIYFTTGTTDLQLL